MEVSITHEKYKDSTSYSLVNERGENGRTVNDLREVLVRTIEFKVGELKFTGTQSIRW